MAIVVGVALGRFAVLGNDDAARSAVAPRPADTATRIDDLARRLEAAPDDPVLLRELGVAHLARFRETADPSYLGRASTALERAESGGPDVADTLVARGLLDLARHDFSAALQRGLRASALAPDSAEPLAVVFDAQVELGAYADAAATAQRMVDLRPSLATLSRVSYIRQLNGDTRGALDAMQAAAAAGGGSAADRSYIQTLLGDLHLGAGRLDDARRQYVLATELQPDNGLAALGLARVEAASDDLDSARRRLQSLVRRVPLPTAVALLGDVEAASGRAPEAAAQYDLVRSIERLNASGGVAVDLELAAFEADHLPDGPRSRHEGLIAAARAARDARPTIYGDDVLGWTLRQAGRPAEALPFARAAVRLGTADALLWYHLAAVEADLGMTEAARQHLQRALSINPHLTERDLGPALALRDALR